MKAQLDHLPLSIGSVRPTQGRTLAVMPVSGGSRSAGQLVDRYSERKAAALKREPTTDRAAIAPVPVRNKDA